MIALAALALSFAQSEAPADAPEVVKTFVADLCAVIDDKLGADVEKLRASFSPEMAKALSKTAIVNVLTPLRDDGDVSVQWSGVEHAPSATTWICDLEQKHSLWRTTISIDKDSHIAGWYIKPAPRRAARKELIDELAKLEGDWGIAMSLYDAKQIELEHVELSSGRRLFPLGSIFKLYVLAELARRVANAELDLDSEFAIDENLKSLPSGEMQNLAAGTKVKLRVAATQMIKISDNTAADHLLSLVGRENVEAHLGEYFNSAPERNRPFLSTLELFSIKGAGAEVWKHVFGVDALKPLALAWMDASSDARREWLSKLKREWPDKSPAERRTLVGANYGLAALGAKEHVEIEWLARPNDVLRLVDAAARGQLVSPSASKIFLDFYAAGTPIYAGDGVKWQGYKGGSESNVVALSSRIVFDDGRSVIGCLMRSGFSALDSRSTENSVALFSAWIRNLVEGDPQRASSPAKAGDTKKAKSER